MPAALDEIKPYYKNPREDLWPFLPESIGAMLDVGCGAGSFAASCKERLGCEAWGIEVVSEMAEIAATRMDWVLNEDAMTGLEKLPAETFDLITFTDVLEHLVEPADALRACIRLLKPGGKILASIPNIRYWHALLTIVTGKDFPYQDSGIFDRTHLRFFTKKSLPRLFKAAGYQIETLQGINGTTSLKHKLLNVLTLGLMADCNYLQYVIVAKPK